MDDMVNNLITRNVYIATRKGKASGISHIFGDRLFPGCFALTGLISALIQRNYLHLVFCI